MKFLSSQIEEMIRVNHAGEMGAKVIYDGQIAALKLKARLIGKSGTKEPSKKSQETLKLVKEMRAQEVEHFDFFDAEIVRQKLRPTVMQPVWKVGGFALGFLTAIIDDKAAMLCTAAVEEVIDEHYQEQIRTLKKHIKRQEAVAKKSDEPGEADLAKDQFLGTSEKSGFFEEFLGSQICEKASVARSTCSRTNLDNNKITEKDGFSEVPLEKNADKISCNLAELCDKIEKFRDDEIEHKNTAYDHQAQEFIAFKPLSCFIKATTKLAIAVSKKI